MAAHRVLHALVRRAARYERPFNSQDSLLIVKALQLLRYRSDDVRGVCEKCAFAIVSSRITVPVERAIEALSSLLSLQAAPLPIVHEKLAERLSEVTPQTASPHSIQKAAVVVMKLGKRYGKPAIADHLFDILTQEAATYPKDAALQLAVISVFMYTSSAAQLEGRRCRGATKAGEEVEFRRTRAVLEAATRLVDAHVLSSLRGNKALQALHIFPVLALRPSTHASTNGTAQAGVNGGSGARGNGHSLGTTLRWDRVENAFREELQLSTVVPGGYAQFLFDFLPIFRTENNDEEGAVVAMKLALLEVLCQTNFHKALNSYDVAKIAMAVSHALPSRSPYAGRQRRMGAGAGTPEVKEDGGGAGAGDHHEALEDRTLLRVVSSLVRQLQFFDDVAGWSRPGGGRVEQVAVGAVWRVTQKLVCSLRPATEEVQTTVAQLVKLTEGIAAKLTDVWSWVLYSMSMCARTAVYTDGVRDVMGLLIQESFLGHRPEALPLRSCVQGLYAVSILVVPSTEERQLLRRRTTAAVEVRERVRARSEGWSPEHPFVTDMLQRLTGFRFRDYSGDDVPMLLKALLHLMELSTAQHAKVSPAVQQLMERVFYYMQGNRNLEWCRMHGVDITCTLISMAEFLPDDYKQLKDVTKHFLLKLQSQGMIDLGVLRRWMEQLAQQKRSGNTSAWLCEEVLALLALQIPRVGTGRKESFYPLLSALECAHAIGGSIAFVHLPEEASNARRVPIFFDLAPLLQDESLTPVDAAHLLRIMSYEVQSSGLLRVPPAHIVRLRCIATCNQAAASMRVETLLHLLRANATLPASKALFDRATLEYIMAVVCHQMTEHRLALMRRGEGSKIVHALLSSQVLLRLGSSLRSYNGLAEAVTDLFDALEATGAERRDTLFQLRLLCGN
ncbi:uncharacterized protein Tco025E_04492 [Trypanosoma conorhini]|uniref:Uncharacterized protein n=1 Tax=Trypanosoma conorhini TaxID=83891 RepID=A0A422PL85_9TRYP|nr:uncharacterized protein Tco025E_04492 [Trypanosoma conorhini]RNF18490.1 hypothetical protein Tco025E_04492 [Trypanosoma conorhini]